MRQFICNLLRVDWRNRLGSCPEGTFHHTAGIPRIKAHPWFEGVDWGLVERRRYRPPVRPQLTQLRVGPEGGVLPPGSPIGHEQQENFRGFEFNVDI